MHFTDPTAMSHKEEANLFRHYGVGYGPDRTSVGKAASPGAMPAERAAPCCTGTPCRRIG